MPSTTPPGTLRNVIGQDLAGFQLVRGYFIERDHGLMGTFPVLIAATDEMVFCTDRGLAERICAMMDRKRKITELWLLVNTDGGFGFSMGVRELEQAERVSILTEAAFKRLTDDIAQPFKWALGLYGA